MGAAIGLVLRTAPGWLKPSMMIGSVAGGSGDSGTMVCAPPPGMLKVIVCVSGSLLAHNIACLKVPTPLSSTLVTTYEHGMGVPEVAVAVAVAPVGVAVLVAVAVGVGVPVGVLVPPPPPIGTRATPRKAVFAAAVAIEVAL